ncbi:MAG: 16S rRNA (uracil(1498)-N(3))-methyltransferase [Vicinamibacterales bacterium]
MHRFFAPELDPGDEHVDLPGDEAEHLTRVLRLGPGDVIAVFNGRGREYLASVATAARRAVRVRLLSSVEPAREAAVDVTLVQAVLKGDRMDEVVRDAVMLGVGAVQPIVSRRTETTVAALLRGARIDRWRRVALASVKQCRRAVLPEIRSPLTLGNWLGEPLPELSLMFVEPNAGDTVEPLAALKHLPAPRSAAMLVGPEGGWDPAERAEARDRGVRLVSLGTRTLRGDAVPIVALGILQFLWDEPLATERRRS